ncbi:hypothetical protein [Pseudanabaena sp. FACHB-2040]|uniref:hypothetical protein n=1 Tax=Pseudanabaena sp. FACHB-2040 TaxID=2692859 RepID=UPI00168217D1|nr:hypothetical protein [Pseudanabaena sp. FACHB-2040]MBD2258814.1 hypothetical protein [Pseudanabaena sp. FACHB-2040]
MPSARHSASDGLIQAPTDEADQADFKAAEPEPTLPELSLPEADLTSVSTSAADLDGVSPDYELWLSSPQPQLAETGPLETRTKSFEFSFAQPDTPLKSDLFSPETVARTAATIAQSAPADSASEDEAELEGVDPELGIIRIRTAVEDPELGIIRLREQPFIPEVATQQPAPIAYLTGRVSLLNSGNIFLALDQMQELVGDQLIRPGISLGLYPALGRETYLLAVADVNFQRYFNVGSANYDEVRLRLGIRQGLTPRSYGQLSWSHQGLFRPGIQDRFFANDSFELLLARRDPLTPEIAVNTYYQLQLNLSNPQSFDRLIQFAGIYASYQITPELQVGLNYQLTLADYTAFERFDTYQQIIGQMVYQITPEVRVSLFGGFSFGRSSLPSVRFEDAILGINFEGTVPLF